VKIVIALLAGLSLGIAQETSDRTKKAIEGDAGAQISLSRRTFSRLESRVFRPAIAMFTANDAVLPFPLRQSLNRVDAELDLLIYDAFPLLKAG
jgi:hypothetical protein